MSRLGYIQNSYGNEFKVAIANTSSNIVLNGSNLPANTVIIASPVNEYNDDTGSYSLIITDYKGTPVRLSYTISEGNGLHIKNDILKLSIDNSTIKENSKKSLYINSKVIIDNDIIKEDNNKLYIDTYSLPISSTYTVGTFRADNETIKVFDNMIAVNTVGLDYSNNNGINNIYGIFTGDSKTVISNNGVLSINIDGLDKADNDGYGLIAVDANTIHSSYGSGLSVESSNLSKANVERFGLVKADYETISCSAESIFSINENSFPEATYTSRGTVQVDGNSIIYNEGGQIEVKNYAEIVDSISHSVEETNNMIKSLDELREEIMHQIS